jgi:hypothetical protein
MVMLRRVSGGWTSFLTGRKVLNGSSLSYCGVVEGGMPAVKHSQISPNRVTGTDTPASSSL